MNKEAIFKYTKFLNVVLNTNLNDDELKKIVNSIDIMKLKFGKYQEKESQLQTELARMNLTPDKKCFLCNKEKKKIVIHHIIPIPFGDNSRSNLMSVCLSCHRKLHSKIANAIGKDWRKYFFSNFFLHKEMKL